MGRYFRENIGNRFPASRNRNLLFSVWKVCLFWQFLQYFIYFSQNCTRRTQGMFENINSVLWDEDCCFPDKWIEFHIILSWWNQISRIKKIFTKLAAVMVVVTHFTGGVSAINHRHSYFEIIICQNQIHHLVGLLVAISFLKVVITSQSGVFLLFSDFGKLLT